MRKISKLSLVAAVAVAGFSTANAQPLEQAIKDVEVSGSVVFRYNNYDDQANTPSNQTESNNYKIGLNLASKVNDYVKFNSRFIVGSTTDAGFASLNSSKDTTNGDIQADVTLSNAYFGLTAIPNTVVNIGKQGLTTPYTVATDINGNEQTGTGILALTTVGPVTAGAGYFNATNLDDSGNGASSQEVTTDHKDVINNGYDMYVATIQGDLDLAKLEAWYAGMQDTFDSYTLAATGKLDFAKDAKVNLEARYVNLTLDSNSAKVKALNLTDDNNGMFRLAADGKFSIVNARLAYTKTDKEGGLTALDQDAKNTSLGWTITSNGISDADYWQAALGADILDNLNFTMHYGNLESDATTNKTLSSKTKKVAGKKLEQEEVYGQLTYKMSKNLNTYLRYGYFEQKIDSKKDMDQDMGRIQVAYSF